jgi:beta-glucanase (GH16 family)
MPFSKFLDKIQDKIQEHIPPQIQNASKPPPPIPTGSKPSSTPVPTFWRADFSPSTAVATNVKHECGDWGWGNNELENYTNTPENSFHTQGNGLVLRAVIGSAKPSDKYTSARLRTHQTLQRRCGYLEATISAPSAKGIWPAFWLLPAEPFNWPVDGEIDIMEAWNGDKTNHCCLHWGHFAGEDMAKHRVCETEISGITKPHVYGFAWDQPEHGDGGRLIWYIDGRPVMKGTRPNGTRRMEDFQVILNVAIGGNVCNGAVPKDGVYDMTVHELKMCDSPNGGWEGFERDWPRTREGHGY